MNDGIIVKLSRQEIVDLMVSTRTEISTLQSLIREESPEDEGFREDIVRYQRLYEKLRDVE